MDKQELETRLPLAFYQVHRLTTKVLRENDILYYEEEQKDDNLKIIVPIVMRLQAILLIKNLSSQEDIKSVIN